MNLLYTAFIREDSESKGFLKKVISQCKVFYKYYDNVYLFLSRKNQAVLYKISNDSKLEIEIFKFNKFYVFDNNDKLKKIKSYFRYSYFLKLVSSIQKKYKIDISYFRSTIPFKPLLNILKNDKIFNIYEYPTYPYEEEYIKTQGLFKYKLFWKKGLEKIEDYVDLIVGISGKKYIEPKEKLVLINNGIDLEIIKKIKKDNKEKKELILISIANVGKWHGYDRIIKGLYNYYKNNPKKEVYYYFVGEGSELHNLKKLTKELNMEKYVIFYGTKTGKELDEIVNKSDVAFGSLGMHRIDLKYASTLKLREYCARGIPFVYSYFDFDFNDFKYSMKIDSDEKPVDIEKVIEFYDSIKNENYIEEMRKYAEDNLTWEAKMKPVIEKINELYKERNFKK